MKKILPLIIVAIILLSGTSITSSINTNKSLETYDLLIITPEMWLEELQTLKEHKESHNMKTFIQTLEEIYDSTEGRDYQEKIKYYIKYALETYGIKYVLLMGGRKPSIIGEPWILPARYSYIEDNVATPEKRFISDLYYADVYDNTSSFSSWDENENDVFSEWLANQSADDTMDLYPDVCLGRLACRNKFEVKIMIKKIINYENNAYDAEWSNKVVVVGGDTYINNDYYEGEVANQQALDFMTDYEHIKLWTSDDSFTDWKDVVSTINKGCGFLFFAGHGSPAAWGTHPPFDNTVWRFGLRLRNMPFLSNGKKLPITVVGGCHNSMFNISMFHTSWTYGVPVAECWSWHLTRNIGGGAIATLGCTGLGYGKEDKLAPDAEGGGDWLNVLFFKEVGESKAEYLGEAWAWAITSYLNEFPIDWNQPAFADTALDAKTVQEWVLLGDPSLKIGGYH